MPGVAEGISPHGSDRDSRGPRSCLLHNCQINVRDQKRHQFFRPPALGHRPCMLSLTCFLKCFCFKAKASSWNMNRFSRFLSAHRSFGIFFWHCSVTFTSSLPCKCLSQERESHDLSTAVPRFLSCLIEPEALPSPG